jgi:hypothetical protein
MPLFECCKAIEMRSIGGRNRMASVIFTRLSLRTVKKLAILTILLFPLVVQAQDMIYKKDGSSVSAKVYEVSNDKIRYKRFDNLQGPFYYLHKGEIDHIEYENGTVESYKSFPQNKPRKFGIGANAGGPSIFYSVELDYRISHNIDIEAGLGNTGAWAGVNYLFRDLRYESVSPYIGFNVNYWVINQLPLQGFYAPLGLSLMSQKTGLGLSVEVAWMNRFQDVAGPWAGAKLSVHL